MNKMKQWFDNRKANEQTTAPSGISRRQFLKVGLVAATASALIPTLAGGITSMTIGERTTAAPQISGRSNSLADRLSNRYIGHSPSLASLAMNGRPFLSF